jgi:hypothetical protein
MPQQLEKCANCDREIIKLETPYQYQGQAVCRSCYDRLVPSVLYATPATPTDTPSAPGEEREKFDATLVMLVICLGTSVYFGYAVRSWTIAAAGVALSLIAAFKGWLRL